ncbi:hypothetical protein D3C78_1474650 [compost metagenome]
MPGGIELAAAAVAIGGFAGTTGQCQGNQWHTDPGFHFLHLKDRKTVMQVGRSGGQKVPSIANANPAAGE